jgi:predicted permease
MPVLSRLVGVWRTLVRPARLERNLDEELQGYVEGLADRYARDGMSPQAARRAALIEVGGIEQVKERVRDARLGAGLESVLQDLRHAVRGLRRDPGFAATAILTLALGIGASVGVFSIVRAVLLCPLPYHDPDRLVFVWNTNSEGLSTTFSSGRLLDLRRRVRSLSGVAGIGHVPVNLLEGDRAERLLGATVSTNFFEVMGVPPLLGRTFDVGREQQRTVILTHGLWMRRFAGDPAIVGRRIRLDAGVYTVAAVMPAGFMWRVVASAPYHGPQPELWIPAPRMEVPPLPSGMGGERLTESRRVAYLRAVARMAPGRSLADVNAELNVLAAQLARQYPDTDKGPGLRAVPAIAQFAGDVRRPLLLLLGAVGMVLAIACANVANLLLGRTVARRGEIAIRLSLGAGWVRLTRQFLVEGLVLSSLAAVAGVLVGRWTLSSLVALSPIDIARLGDTRIDGAVLAFAVLAAIATGVVLALVPAIDSLRLPTLMHEASLRASRRSRSTRGGALLVGEVAMAVTLVVGAGLLVRSLVELRRVDVGIDNPGQVLSFGLSIGGERARTPGQQEAFYRETLEKITSLPEVGAAGATLALPMGGDENNSPVWVDGQPPSEPGKEELVSFQSITPGYFRALGLRMLAGRDVLGADGATSPKVVVVNGTFARRHWGSVSPLGQRLRLGIGPGTDLITIVGVVQDVRQAGPSTPPRPEVFVPASQQPFPFMSFVVRADADPRRLVPALRAAVASIDATQPIADVRTMDDYLQDGLAQPRFLAALLTGFGALALLLAAIGVYGVASWSVIKRRREIGVRMAVGATPRQIAKMVLREGGARLAIGFAIGTGAAIGLSRLLTGLLYGVRPADPTTYAAALAILTGVAIAALWLPAYRASRVEASTVLRE